MSQIYRLGSSSLVYAPGVVRVAVDTYKANPAVSIRLIADGWGVPAEIAKQVCRKELPYRVEGETVIVDATPPA